MEFLFAYSLALIAAALQQSHVTVLWSSGIAAAVVTMYLRYGKDIPGIKPHRKPSYNLGAIGLIDFFWGFLSRSDLGVKDNGAFAPGIACEIAP